VSNWQAPDGEPRPSAAGSRLEQPSACRGSRRPAHRSWWSCLALRAESDLGWAW